jgi:hypothetical protein
MQPRLRNKILQIAAFLSLLLFAGSFLYAQVSAGAISGTVTDPTQAAIAGAKVTITNQETGISHVLTTDRSGFYSAEGLPVGQLKKITALIAAGGIVLAPKPTQSPSLSDGANAKNEVHSIADEIWGPANPLDSRQIRCL